MLFSKFSIYSKYKQDIMRIIRNLIKLTLLFFFLNVEKFQNLDLFRLPSFDINIPKMFCITN